jgi:hypothetical protein
MVGRREAASERARVGCGWLSRGGVYGFFGTGENVGLDRAKLGSDAAGEESA